MVAQDSDLTFVFGMLATKLDFISSEHMAIAMQAWQQDQTTPIGEILHQQGVLSPDERELLDALSKKYLGIHGGDARRSLAAISATDLVKRAMRGIHEEDPPAPTAPAPTPGTLQRDLERWLADFPAATTPNPVGVKAWRFVNRHRALAASAFAASVVAILGLGLTIYILSSVVGSARKSNDDLKASLAEETKAHREFENDARLAHLHEQKTRDALEDMKSQKKSADDKWTRAEGKVYAHQIESAQTAWRDNNARLATHYLDATREDLRGWEHRYLVAVFNRGQTTINGHTKPVTNVAFSRDGRRLVSGGEDGAAIAWDPSTGRKINPVDEGKLPIRGLALMGDNKRVAICRGEPSIKICQDGKETLLKGHAGKVMCLAVSADGKRLVSGSEDKLVKVWEVQSGDSTLSLSGHTDAVLAVAINDEGTQVASASADGMVKVWDIESGLPIYTLTGHKGAALCVAFSGDGTRVVSGGRDGTIKVWDLEDGKEAYALAGHIGGVGGIAINMDATRLVSGGADGMLKIWDALAGKELQTLKGHTAAVACVALSADGRRYASGCVDGSVKVWDARIRQETPTLKDLTHSVDTVAITTDGRTIVSGSRDGKVMVWDRLSTLKPATIAVSKFPISSIGISGDGRRIVTVDRGAGTPGVLKLWSVSSAKEIATLKGHETGTVGVVISGDGNRIVSYAHETDAKVWNGHTGQEMLAKLPHENSVLSVAINGDGQRIATGGADGQAKVWDSQTGKLLMSVQGTNTVAMIAISADGKRVVTGDELATRLDGRRAVMTLHVWDVESGQQIVEFESLALVQSIALSPDGKRIAGGLYNGEVVIWDAQTGHGTMVLKGHTGYVNSVAFSGDGRIIVSGGDDKSVMVWEAR